MRKKLLALVSYAVVLAIDFYLLPLLIKDTGTAMLFLLCIMPLITFVSSVIYGVHQGFDLLLPLTTMLLFTPTIFIYYNSSAWVYIIGYAIVTLIGNGIGRIFYKKR